MDGLNQFLLAMPVLLFSMVAHEYAHGYAALKQGDPTAYQLGRLTWNPMKHLDPMMSVVVPAITYFTAGFMFGGAKPVPVVPRNYRNYKRGDIIVSMAGIATNLVLAVVATLLTILIGLLARAVPAANDTLALLQVMMRWGIVTNLMLAIFNLLPIPPLDGSHVMKYLLPPAWSLQYQRIGAYGFMILMLLMVTQPGRALMNIWMTPMQIAVGYAFRFVDPYIVRSAFTAGGL